MFEFFAFTFFKRFESLFEVICPIQSVSWAWIPMPAFGQGPLKQGRSGRSNFIAGFVRGCLRNQGSHAPITSWNRPATSACGGGISLKRPAYKSSSASVCVGSA